MPGTGSASMAGAPGGGGMVTDSSAPVVTRSDFIADLPSTRTSPAAISSAAPVLEKPNILAMAATYSPRAGEPLGLELPFELQTAAVREEVWRKWLARDPVRFVPQRIEEYRKLKSVFIDCGTRDEFNLRWGARMVAAALRKGAVNVVHEEFEDGHMGINYRYERSLSWLIPRLS